MLYIYTLVSVYSCLCIYVRVHEAFVSCMWNCVYMDECMYCRYLCMCVVFLCVYIYCYVCMNVCVFVCICVCIMHLFEYVSLFLSVCLCGCFCVPIYRCHLRPFPGTSVSATCLLTKICGVSEQFYGRMLLFPRSLFTQPPTPAPKRENTVVLWVVMI